ncbi:hypothetical protein [Sphingomonas sp. CARO-RG-8B-R24-01]|uniref:hypothetical protein n=1 Tax=Sphingomonas sp. CARO-RG-8B-R24-01 TaxID=2914831 RepID=UPI001F57FB57|nr:hypothetical protein [Sphingomonas sp. CARO-RG-8B-R24-01]
MAAIITGIAHCNRPGCTSTRQRDPVLEVPRPDCGAGIGVRCRRPSGHAGNFTDLHAARDLLADASGAYGHCPLGLCGAANRPTQSAFAF